MDTPQPVSTARPKVRLSDYTPPPFEIAETHLDFDLYPVGTVVKSKLLMKRRGSGSDPLFLDGDELELVSVAIDGKVLEASAYRQTPHGLEIPDVPDDFVLEIENKIDPANNTKLEGLYVSGGRFCSQCEAQGFRRITFFYDRPDVLSRYFVRVAADKAKYPTLLSNGDLMTSGGLDDGRHFAEFKDPYPKPCYLFAVVAGEFDTVSDKFVTMSGREVGLHIHVDPGDADRALFGLDALKRSMKWDEDTFHREYDLSAYHIVAVRDFNFGAMENKGLNVFNSSRLLVDHKTSTDDDFRDVERVIAHEYFHNWTGNRITLRDWFHLCLKEGLTVYRDQEFSADQLSADVQRIKDVTDLRSTQYPEDAGPSAHPVRLSEYTTVENFYTSTVYRKGAELIRVLREVVGPDTFRAGMQRYFEKCDGTAATLEDFVSAFEETAGHKLTDFFRWYAQAGTPRLKVNGKYDSAAKTYTLAVEQSIKPTPGQPVKEPMPIPLRMGLISRKGGKVLSSRLEGGNAAKDEHRDVLTEPAKTYVFEDVEEEPIATVLRGFNAPVIVEDDLTTADRVVQMAHDPDPFTRWDAGQSLMQKAILGLSRGDDGGAELSDEIVGALQTELSHADDDRLFTASTIRVPTLVELVVSTENADPEVLHVARQDVRRKLYEGLEQQLVDIVDKATPDGDDRSSEAIGRRALRSAALSLLGAGGDAHRTRIAAAFATAKNMTETMAALRALVEIGGNELDAALAAFEKNWSANPLVMDKWFHLQSTSPFSGTATEIKKLAAHDAFTYKNPNRVRSVYGAFGLVNLRQFHAADGSGYEVVTDAILKLDTINPMQAARLVRAFDGLSSVDATRQKLGREILSRKLMGNSRSNNLTEALDTLDLG